MKTSPSGSKIARIMGSIAVLSSLQIGCLELNEDHCLANGGDFACPGRMCLVQTGAKVETISDYFGCSYTAPTTKNVDYHIKAEFGLPAEFEIRSDIPSLDTVVGVLLEAQEELGIAEPCSLDDPELEDQFMVLDQRYDAIHALRSRLEDVERKRGEDSIRLLQDEADAVPDYNHAVHNWLNKCREKRSMLPPAPES